MDGDSTVRARVVHYLELVERWGLCPWAAGARRDGTLRVEIVRGDDAFDQASAIGARWIAGAVRIGLIVVLSPGLDPGALRRLRDRLTAAHPAFAIADFHPDGGDPARALDGPARLVPLLRRSPDPMLQLVPHVALAALAAPPPVASASAQVAMLTGGAPAPTPDPRTRIADDNLATVRMRGLDQLLAELASLRA